MSFQDFRRYNELMFIEQQLKLYQHKMRELEGRQKALKVALRKAGYGYQVPEPFGSMLENLKSAFSPPQFHSRSEAAAPAMAPEKEAVRESSVSPELVALLAKENVVGVLGEVNVLLKTFSDVIGTAEKYVQTFTSIINLIEQSGLDIRRYFQGAVDEIRAHFSKPAGDPLGKAYMNPEAEPSAEFDADASALSRLVSDVVQSPLFQQLAEKFAHK
ncbi:MAG: hypothetical protein HPY50_13025 [Firmicutes bacterium]|nr:hypothetical protein [Bacillota bacterium]